MSQLASTLGIERSNATVLVNELEDQGLVLRKTDPNDRRTRLVVATRKGKKLVTVPGPRPSASPRRSVRPPPRSD